MRAQSRHVTQRCHNRNPRWETGLGSANDVTHWKRAQRILGDLKKSLVELCLAVWRRRVTSACSPKPGQWPCDRCHTCWWGADGKASIERLCLSPYVEKPFNSKVIKSFVPELRSRKCFSHFRIPMFYIYMLRTFYVRFNISISGYVTGLCVVINMAFCFWSASGMEQKLSSYTCYKIAEGFWFMPLSLVRLRTFQLSTWVS